MLNRIIVLSLFLLGLLIITGCSKDNLISINNSSLSEDNNNESQDIEKLFHENDSIQYKCTKEWWYDYCANILYSPSVCMTALEANISLPGQCYPSCQPEDWMCICPRINDDALCNNFTDCELSKDKYGETYRCTFVQCKSYNKEECGKHKRCLWGFLAEDSGKQEYCLERYFSYQGYNIQSRQPISTFKNSTCEKLVNKTKIIEFWNMKNEITSSYLKFIKKKGDWYSEDGTPSWPKNLLTNSEELTLICEVRISNATDINKYPGDGPSDTITYYLFNTEQSAKDALQSMKYIDTNDGMYHDMVKIPNKKDYNGEIEHINIFEVMNGVGSQISMYYFNIQKEKWIVAGQVININASKIIEYMDFISNYLT